jgi:hypothetical protein
MVLGLYSKKSPQGKETLGGFSLVPSGIPFSWFSPDGWLIIDEQFV